MATRQQHYARRYSMLMLARGGPVTIRAYSVLAGPTPAPNPARVQDLVVAGAHTAGATTLNLRGTAIAGRFIVGDRFLAGSTVLGAAASQAIATGTTAAVALAAGLPTSLSDGTAITMDWAAEKVVQAQTRPYSRRLVDGQMIEMRDLMVTVAANDMPGTPNPQWQLVMPDGDVRSIISITPGTVDGLPISYTFQAR